MQIVIYNFSMNKQEFLKLINNFKSGFDFESIKGKGSKTQRRAEITENYVESFLIKLIDDIDCYIFQAGSQQPYDFIVIKKERVKKWPSDFREEFLKKYNKDGKVHGLIKKQFKNLKEEVKRDILRIEVKAGQGNYYGNDTLPDPENPVIYFFFDWKLDKIYIASSVEMAKKDGEDVYKDLLKKYIDDTIQINEWRNDKIEQWKGSGISSVPRMTYKFNSTYAYTEQSDEEFNRLFDVFDIALWKE